MVFFLTFFFFLFKNFISASLDPTVSDNSVRDVAIFLSVHMDMKRLVRAHLLICFFVVACF